MALACVGIFILLLIGFLYLTRSLFAPVATAALFSMLFGPLAVRAEKYNIPITVFAIVCVLVAVAVANGIFIGLGQVVANWSSNAQAIGAALKTAVHVFEGPIATWQELHRSLTSMFGGSTEPIKFDLPTAGIVTALLEFLTPAIGELVIFFGCLFFFIVSRKGFRRFLVLALGDQNAKLRALRVLNEIEENLVRYFGAVTVVNIAVGVVTAGVLYAVGLPDPALWGFVAFLLNYIPYVGPAILLVILLVQGLVAFSSFQAALIAPAILLVLATMEGHFITPSLIGRRLTMSPLAMFLSLAFWTWLWGPLGTFVAMPFLIAMTVIYNNAVADDKLTLPG
jgi:predicted PurR-regulated permease PerM